MTDITEDDHRLWPPERELFPVRRLELRLRAGEHPFHASEKLQAAENWQKEIAANPAFYDGRMVFQHRLRISDGTIEGEGYLVPFSTFLWWRRQQPARKGFHLFGLPVPVSSDGAIIAIRMAAHTANPGMVYCPAGSLEACDVVDGLCDIAGNMAREVREETGLDLAAAKTDGQLFASHAARRVTICQIFRFDRTADELLAEIEAHMAQDEEKEIAGAVAIRSGDPESHPYNPAMLPLLSWFFGSRA